jgi:hypothetical protein
LRPKQAELLRDLSKVLTKYSTRDWEPIVRLLSGSKSNFEAVVALIDGLGRPPTRSKKGETKTREIRKSKALSPKKSLAKGKKKAATKSLTRRGRKGAEPKTGFLPHRILGRISTGQLRSLYGQVFNSKQTPPARSGMIAELSEYLERQPDDARAAILISLSSRSDDAIENYRRWARIISTPLRSRSK